MSSATAEAPKTVWKMPKVQIGQIVLWYRNGLKTMKPQPAVVEEVGACNNINLVPLLRREMIVASRHIDDPSLRDNDRLLAGAWDLTDETKAIRELLGT